MMCGALGGRKLGGVGSCMWRRPTEGRQIMIRVANAPCSWGVIENVAGERGGYATVIDEMHATGYSGTELGDWGFMPTDPATLRQELAARDLQLLASWVSVFLHDAD